MLDGHLLVDAHVHVPVLGSLKPAWVQWARDFGQDGILDRVWDSDGRIDPVALDELFAEQGVDAALLFCEYSPKVTGIQRFEDLLPIFARADIYLGGAFALEQGQILSAMLLAAMTVFIIERQFAWAGVCMLVAASFSWVGLMHSYRWMPSDTVLQPGWGSGSTWTTGYLLLALLFYWAAWKER